MKKLALILLTFLLPFSAQAQTYTMNSNLKVKGTIEGGIKSQGFNNLSFSLSGGVFKITCGGAVCSTSNPGFITLPSAVTPGLLVTLRVTGDDHEIEDINAGADLTGHYFGTASTDGWAENRPFYVYAVNQNDTEAGVEFAISVTPNYRQMPDTFLLGYHGNAPATNDDRSVTFMTPTNVTATHNLKPSLRVGSLRGTKSNIHEWTFTALDNVDGPGSCQDGRKFIMPPRLGSNFFVSAGTNPTYTDTSYFGYTIDCDNGLVHGEFSFVNSAGGTAGAGVNPLALIMPIRTGTFSDDFFFFGFGLVGESGGVNTPVQLGIQLGGDDLMEMHYSNNPPTTLSVITGNDQSSAVRFVRGSFMASPFEKP